MTEKLITLSAAGTAAAEAYRALRTNLIFNHPDDLRKHGIFSQSRCTHLEEPSFIDGTTDHSRTRLFINRKAFAGNHGFVGGGGAFEDRPVNGNFFT